MGNEKPKAKLIGQDGNIFNLMAIAAKAMRKAKSDKVDQMIDEVTNSNSYDEALRAIARYVDIE
jgi:macrodomain Ter protein organizer (MatP/YcbG family)